MKHTVGPWRLSVYKSVAGEVGTILDANGEEVANLHGPDGTIEPDGRLMAAAPEMLDALKSVETAIYDALHAGNLSRAYAGGAIGKIEAAIRKAEGTI